MMVSALQTAPISRKKMWAGRTLSGLAALLLLGYPESEIIGIGILLLVCTIVYIIPRTVILGAILHTGYLGNAVATHLRVGDPLFLHVLFPTYVGALLWGGLCLREERLRGLIPLRRKR